jgi:hypothetical protein
MNGMRVAQGMSQSLCIVILLLICVALFTQSLSAQNQDHRVRNIVLVHVSTAAGEPRTPAPALLHGSYRPSFLAAGWFFIW